MKWCALVLLLSGCYAPKLASPGFHCHPEDVPACPDGQTCVDGRCQFSDSKSPNDGGAGDLAQSSGGDMHESQDLKQSIDFAKPADLSQPPDLSSGCVPTNGDCTYHNNAICCSNYCIYSSNTCK